MSKPLSSKSIVFISKDSILQKVIRSLVAQAIKSSGENLDLISAINGVEGLGNIFVNKPSLVLVDVNIPQYSGKELIHFLYTNKNFKDLPVIVIHQGQRTLSLPRNYVDLDSRFPKFLERLWYELSRELSLNLKKGSGVRKVFSISNMLLKKSKPAGLNELYFQLFAPRLQKRYLKVIG